MAKISLDLSQFKASGIYTVEFDASESIVINTQTTRLVVGFSKKGPINAPVFCNDVKSARRIFGDIDKDLENKGSFFHRSLFTCLETGPCFALNLVPLNNDLNTSNPDIVPYNSYSLSTTELNGTMGRNALYSSFFNKERFYFPDTSYFLATVDASTSPNKGKLFNFVNLGQNPFSIIIRKTGSLPGFDVAARDWFGPGNVPDYVKEFDFISEYFVTVDVVAGDWTDYRRLAVDPIFSQYFTTAGVKKTKLTDFLNSAEVTRIASFQGCIIPDLVDNNGVNYSIDTIVNAGVATTGLFCALNRDALNDYDPASASSVGRVDMVGHTLIDNNTTGVVRFLSYDFPSLEIKSYTEGLTHSVLNNTYQFDLGTGASGNLPGGSGSTGAAYSASADGYSLNLPTKSAYLTSFYGQGNQGRFNNVLVLRKETFSSTQYANLLTMVPGTSIVLQGASGATMYGTISSVNQETVGSNVRLKLGISHPLKATEGRTTGKNAQVQSVTTGASAYMILGGTAAANDINDGDWVYAEYSGIRYYFRVTSASATGSNSQVYVDVTNSEFEGSTRIENISTLYTVYWESIAGSAGSLFDVINQASNVGTLTLVKSPDITKYFNGTTGSQDYYIGYENSALYRDFNQGILADGDKVYISGPTTLYVNSSFTTDSDSVKTVNVKAFTDPEMTIGYTGSWTFNESKLSSGSTGATGALKVYSLVGDYELTVGATGFNTSRTSFYVTAGNESKIQVGNYLVADPLNTGDSGTYVLTRVVSKKKILTGTYKDYYQINVKQRLANYGTDVNRFKSVDQVATNYRMHYLSGFKLTSYHIPDGSNAQLAKILGMLEEANSNLSAALSSRHIIAFRYIVDTFNGGLDTQSYPKNIITKLAKKRQKCMAIMNAPSISKFIASTNPRFTDEPTATDPKPLLKTNYIAEGGNLSLSPSFTYSLPDEENGSKFSGFFAPFLTFRENNKNFSVPPAADVSNNFIRKFINGQPYSIVAGPRRGVLSNPKLVGLEYDFTDKDREYLEPFGWNPIVFRRGIGFMIFGNQSAYQATPSAFNNLHVRDLLITVEEAIEDVLANFLFEFNDASTRLQIKSIVDAYLDNVRAAGGIYDYATVMDESNNTPDIIDQNFAIIDVGIEPARGAQKFINRITVLKTGGISSGGFTIS